MMSTQPLDNPLGRLSPMPQVRPVTYVSGPDNAKGGGEGVSQPPLKDKVFSTFLDQNPPFELRPRRCDCAPDTVSSAIADHTRHRAYADLHLRGFHPPRRWRGRDATSRRVSPLPAPTNPASFQHCLSGEWRGRHATANALARSKPHFPASSAHAHLKSLGWR